MSAAADRACAPISSLCQFFPGKRAIADAKRLGASSA
jgi:hypothetical protein